MKREPNTIYIASISYGKDSLAMLEAIKQLGYPLDEIITAQVWATQDIPADLPEMYEWKSYADKVIKQKYGLEVTKVYATNKQGYKVSYEDIFYRERKPREPKDTDASHSRGGGDGQCTDGQLDRGVGQQVCSKYSLKTNTAQVSYGFPSIHYQWCTGDLKTRVVRFSLNNRSLVQQQTQSRLPKGFQMTAKHKAVKQMLCSI